MRLDGVNARIGARRARRIGGADLRELLARPTLEARLDLLRVGPLGRDLPAALAPGPDPLAQVEAALREGVRREAAALLRLVEGRRARALLTALVELDEGEAVKAVLRGVSAGLPIDRTLAAAPPTPGLPEPVLRRAAGEQTPAAALAILAGAGSRCAAAAAALLAEAPPAGLPAAELAADREAFDRARAAARRAGEDAALLLAHLEDRVDARNAATLLAVAVGRAPAAAWIPGGRRLSPAMLSGLAAAGPDAARLALARAFRGIPAAALGSPWGADRALERVARAPLLREARRRPLSLAVPLAYLAVRREEVRRVALLLRGAALGLPAEEILDLAEA